MAYFSSNQKSDGLDTTGVTLKKLPIFVALDMDEESQSHPVS